jgi:outer membrane lipoprotein carrier protein
MKHLCMTLLLLAQTVPPARTGPAVAREIEARYHHARTLEAVFVERYSDGRDGMRAESGTVYFSRPGRMRWEYEAPQKKLFVADGKYAWLYVPADRTASRSRMKDSADWRTPLALITGKGKFSRFCGSVTLVGGAAEQPEERPAAAADMVLKCVPRAAANGGEGAFREILMEVDAQFRLVRVLIREPGNVETEFRFGDWQEDVPLAESKFHFEPPVGVAIVDESALAEGAH